METLRLRPNVKASGTAVNPGHGRNGQTVLPADLITEGENIFHVQAARSPNSVDSDDHKLCGDIIYRSLKGRCGAGARKRVIFG